MTDEEKINIIYNSLDEKEELIFTTKEERINFNKYVMYLNFLESLGKIKVRISENYIKREWKIIVNKNEKIEK